MAALDDIRTRHSTPATPGFILTEEARASLIALLYKCRTAAYQQNGRRSEMFEAAEAGLQVLGAERHPMPWGHGTVDCHGDQALYDATGIIIPSKPIPDRAAAKAILTRAPDMTPEALQQEYGINLNWETNS